MLPDKTGKYAALYRPIHMIGLELGISVASCALRNEPTGAPTGFRSDVVATAKRDLRSGETLDGEGGYTVWGKLLPAQRSLEIGGLPLALAHGAKLVRPVRAGKTLAWADVVLDEALPALRVRREMETLFAAPSSAGRIEERVA
jgi:predicted homoserine dehydrogenase-like protein